MPTTQMEPETVGAPAPVTPRLQQFQAEVDQLKVTGGRANPERVGRGLGAVLMAIGIVIGLYAYLGLSHPTTNPLQQGDATVVGLLGVSVTLVGAALFVVFSLTRYFRYWLVRLIYEQRDQMDRLRG